MNEKEQVLIELLSEIHEYCKKEKITYYLDERSTVSYSPMVRMDAEGLLKFAKTFKANAPNRALEWKGNNYRFLGKHIRYINLDTLYYTEDRLFSEKYLGMFVTIDTINTESSKWKSFERRWKYFHTTGDEHRLAVLNEVASACHKSMVNSTGKKKINKKNLVEVEYNNASYFVKKDSAFTQNFEEAFEKAIKPKDNSETFLCDAEISFKDMDLNNLRKSLYSDQKTLKKTRIQQKRGEVIRVNCAHISRASFIRYSIATQLLQHYSCEEIAERGNEEPIKSILDNYVAEAKKLRDKEKSVYISESFSKALKKLYPDLNVEDLYKFTPDLYKKGIPLYDSQGELIKTYGGIDE